MKPALGQLREFVYAVMKTAKVRKRLMAVAGAIIILQLYFVRELIAAELLFGLGFAVMLVLAGFLYVVGAIGERGFDLTEAGARAVGRSARLGYGKMAPVVHAIGERGFEVTRARVGVIARSARRGFSKLEEVSKRPFRHPRSESVR
jgi:hypothetical protein